MRINKSKFTPEELKQYEALIAKAKEPDEMPAEDIIKNTPPTPDIKPEAPEVKPEESVIKSELAPEVAAELADLKKFREAYEKQQAREVAKKYALLGKDEDKLTDTLHRLKKSDEASYNALLEAMDENLAFVQKTGLFAEIGKSGHGCYYGQGTVAEKIELAATDIQKSNPNLDRPTAIRKAWEAHPELVHEYEEEYRRTR